MTPPTVATDAAPAAAEGSRFGLGAAIALIMGSIIGVGVFNLPTQDREDDRQHGDGRVPHEAGALTLLAVDPAPLQLCRRGEEVGDRRGDARHQDECGEGVRAARPRRRAR